ncbi:membrane protein [Bacillus sp. SA1-12]|uniref:DUF1648 domain-containing protein n=1 Tax=Bacillus sp. SA1-12 TaxID=1455638 RepID=UPI0006273432|nr:DUF1648 domain-containing protein [Bacillus sp. SA1-12]KKI89165.1 membrane protein [Bacillus sp. SA1-12]
MKLLKTKGEWIWDIIGYSSYAASIIFLIFVWSILPGKVPGHYNASGEVDRWGSKWELLILPLVGAVIIVIMQVLERFPEVHNYPERLKKMNAAQFHLHSRKLVNQLKNICLVLFALILFESVSIALGWGSGFGKWILPVTIIGTGFPILAGILKQRKIK